MRKLKRKQKISNTKPPILIFDATALSYAAFYSIGSTLSFNGRPTAVIYGFLRRVLKAGIQFKSNEMIFCWDAGHSWREINYPLYKLPRKKKKEEASPEDKQTHNELLLQQVELNHSVLPKMGLKNTFCIPKYEGDDLIGYFVKNKFKNRRKIIFTSDNDLYQLLDKADIFLLHTKKMFTHKDFRAKYGIHADQWALAKAIGGCSLDNVIGVKGVSDPKSTSSYALKYVRGELTKGKVFESIEKQKEDCVAANLPLVTVPYMANHMPRMLIRRNKVTRRKLIEQFDRFRFISFLENKNFEKWEDVFNL